ncbi:MAG: hypothetical protein JSW58_15325 [Candidatus Latescibacterota bacterium]|nr:MAG: hypothetical protein JSW58_15325 [Candidatus Latescibacterota bacterium]
MKKVALLTFVGLLCATTVYGQAGVIVLAGDAQGLDCNLSDKSPGVCSFYAVHILTPGAMACSFSAPAPSCFTGSWLSDAHVFPVTLGDSQNGVAIGYGECRPGPIHVLTLNFFCQGLSQNCCYYSVKPHPDVTSGEVEVVDCNENPLYARGGFGIVNSTTDCECGPPTRDSTWGKVKSTFGD